MRGWNRARVSRPGRRRWTPANIVVTVVALVGYWVGLAAWSASRTGTSVAASLISGRVLAEVAVAIVGAAVAVRLFSE